MHWHKSLSESLRRLRMLFLSRRRFDQDLEDEMRLHRELRALASQLFGVTMYDPVILGGTVGLLAICAVAAACLPALRAASIDPIQALRAE